MKVCFLSRWSYSNDSDLTSRFRQKSMERQYCPKEPASELGLFDWKKMFFWLCIKTATFQMVIKKILAWNKQKLVGMVMRYNNDTITAPPNDWKTLVKLQINRWLHRSSKIQMQFIDILITEVNFLKRKSSPRGAWLDTCMLSEQFCTSQFPRIWTKRAISLVLLFPTVFSN